MKVSKNLSHLIKILKKVQNMKILSCKNQKFLFILLIHRDQKIKNVRKIKKGFWPRPLSIYLRYKDRTYWEILRNFKNRY